MFKGEEIYMRNLKQRMRNSESLVGMMVTTFSHPDIVRLIKNCGYDFFLIDTPTLLSIEQTEHQFDTSIYSELA